ncbi:MAG: hypothetical protein ACYCSG_04280 [Thermoplasmataceae archaeon]
MQKREYRIKGAKMDKKCIGSESEIQRNCSYQFQEIYANNILSGMVKSETSENLMAQNCIEHFRIEFQKWNIYKFRTEIANKIRQIIPAVKGRKLNIYDFLADTLVNREIWFKNVIMNEKINGNLSSLKLLGDE